MAIRFGMTVADMIRQLTRGFRAVAGREPDGLEKIKIQQEAVLVEFLFFQGHLVLYRQQL